MKTRSNKEVTSKQGMTGSKGQGGSEFDRAKGQDKFAKSDERQNRDEVSEGGHGRGSGKAKTNLNPSESNTYYNGAVQHRGEQGNREPKKSKGKQRE
jgi:hypothetical protein